MQTAKSILILVAILTVGWFTYKHMKKVEGLGLPDTSKFQSAIDSLNNVIALDKQKLIVYDSIVFVQEEKIATLKNRLAVTAQEAEKAKNKYEKANKRFSKLSDSALIREFTNTFR